MLNIKKGTRNDLISTCGCILEMGDLMILDCNQGWADGQCRCPSTMAVTKQSFTNERCTIVKIELSQALFSVFSGHIGPITKTCVSFYSIYSTVLCKGLNTSFSMSSLLLEAESLSFAFSSQVLMFHWYKTLAQTPMQQLNFNNGCHKTVINY